ncbi:hypothetical protein [Allomesorhizobium alhagi]|uniref:Uncharacterized protein n=1 Tax=Mesorhizobium alhagi CCNWXJ12-2 TaxID=1107882 RepID=H0HNF1_9HYPH|nr:hypothetical protein [Mesorhizobium alhagi]EHK57723.1 hypothetical protein MAXJ12_08369 [Mesorhizobium alhagi CCNWXJ12-2]
MKMLAQDQACTDCGGTGETYQTEKRCACQPYGSDIATASDDAASAIKAAYFEGFVAASGGYAGEHTATQYAEKNWPYSQAEADAATYAGLPSDRVADMVDELRAGVAVCGETSSGAELYDIDAAETTMAKAAEALREKQAELDTWRDHCRDWVARTEKAESYLRAVEAERDEAVNWSGIVDRHGTDQFDDLAEAWLELDAIKRVTNAVTSTFSKWADDALMDRFRKHQLSMFHMAFVEGCLAGVKAAEAREKQALAALAPFADAAKDFDGEPDSFELYDHGFLTVGDLRRARALTNEEGSNEPQAD